MGYTLKSLDISETSASFKGDMLSYIMSADLPNLEVLRIGSGMTGSAGMAVCEAQDVKEVKKRLKKLRLLLDQSTQEERDQFIKSGDLDLVAGSLLNKKFETARPLLEELLQLGMDPNIFISNRPLLSRVWYLNEGYQWMEFVLSHGANPNTLYVSDSSKGLTNVLREVVESCSGLNCEALARLLIHHGALVNLSPNSKALSETAKDVGKYELSNELLVKEKMEPRERSQAVLKHVYDAWLERKKSTAEQQHKWLSPDDI